MGTEKKGGRKMERLKPAIVFLLLKILILGATIPTVDTYLDLGLCWNLYMGGHYLWSFAILLPVLLCFVFTSFAFCQFPFQLSYHQYIGIPALILQVWPQYVCLSIAYEVLSGKEGWRTKWEYYSRNISTLEPFLESSVQLVIKLCIWTFFAQHIPDICHFFYMGKIFGE